MQTLRLAESKQVTLNGSGAGEVALGPTSYKELWRIQIVGVRVSTNTNEPTCRIHLGKPNDMNFIGGTYSGSQDADTSITVTLLSGQQIYAVWTGGDAGATASLILIGEKEVG